MTVKMFDIECDHDFVRITKHPLNDAIPEVLFEGGCQRGVPGQDVMKFSVTAAQNTTVEFYSDGDTVYGGLVFEYEFASSNGATTLANACPTSCEVRGHGTCRKNVCACNPGFTGEDCSAYILCSGDESKNHHSGVCQHYHGNNGKAFIVSSSARDEQGNGAIGIPLSRTNGGKIGKPLKSINAGLLRWKSLDGNDIIIVIYPGTYEGASNCNLNLFNNFEKRIAIHGALFRPNNFFVEANTYETKPLIQCPGERWIDVRYSSLELSGVRITSCASSDAGGAVSITSVSSVEMNDVHIDNSMAENGGAVNVGSKSDLKAFNSSFSGNIANVSGGAFIVDDATVSLFNTRVESNRAKKHGGGSFLTNNAQFFGNSNSVLDANDAAEFGGNVAAHLKSHIEGFYITNGKAAKGGGIGKISEECTFTDCKTSVNLCQIVYNEASHSGGGLYVGGRTIMELVSTNVLQNHASLSGGGGRLDSGSKIVLRETYVEDNVANTGGGFSLETDLIASIEGVGTAMIKNNSAALSGGGVHIHAVAGSDAIPAVITLKKLQIVQNHAGGRSSAVGGGLKVESFGRNLDNPILLVDLFLHANYAASDGGGMHLSGQTTGKIYISGCNITQNIAAKSGGGLYAINFHTVIQSSDTYRSSRFANNKALDGGGVAVYNSDQHTAHIENINGVLSNNIATMYGGNIFIYGDNVESCQNVTLVGMELVSGLANFGGNLASVDCSLRVLTSNLYGGSANTSGGAIFMANSHIRLGTSRIEHNKAIVGGGIGLIGKGNVKFLKDVIIVHNMASYGGGIALQKGSSQSLKPLAGDALLIEENKATFGGGIFTNLTTAEMDNVHIRGNVGTQMGGGIHIVNSNLRISGIEWKSNSAMESDRSARVRNYPLENLFAQFDLDSDGNLEEAEVASFAEEMGFVLSGPTDAVTLTTMELRFQILLNMRGSQANIDFDTFRTWWDTNKTALDDSLIKVKELWEKIEQKELHTKHLEIVQKNLAASDELDLAYFDTNLKQWFLPVALIGHGVQDMVSRIESICKEYKGTKYRRCDATPVHSENDEYESLRCNVDETGAVSCEGGTSHWYKSPDDENLVWNPRYGKGGAISAKNSVIYHLDVVVTGNVAGSGGGLYLEDSEYKAIIKSKGSTAVFNNFARRRYGFTASTMFNPFLDGMGGGICVVGRDNKTSFSSIESVDVINNTAAIRGGA